MLFLQMKTACQENSGIFFSLSFYSAWNIGRKKNHAWGSLQGNIIRAPHGDCLLYFHFLKAAVTAFQGRAAHIIFRAYLQYSTFFLVLRNFLCMEIKQVLSLQKEYMHQQGTPLEADYNLQLGIAIQHSTKSLCSQEMTPQTK